jgi:hypothetical protein
MKLKVLVLGGNGFVGNSLSVAAANQGYDVCAVSRRGELESNIKHESITHVKADASDVNQLREVFYTHGKFHAVVHTIGVLFDSSSGLLEYNKYLSGSGSVPSDEATYDEITRKTAYNAIDLAIEFSKMPPIVKQIPFIFISAGEARWTQNTPLQFLERYLRAKRKVENKLLSNDTCVYVRPIVMRPSMIWTTSKPLGFLTTIPFYISYYINLPFFDKPVQLNNLVLAIMVSIQNDTIKGVQTFNEIETLCKEKLRNTPIIMPSSTSTSTSTSTSADVAKVDGDVDVLPTTNSN